MRRGISVALVAVLAGCGGSGLEGTLQWDGNPHAGAHSVSGRVRNTTSHSVTLDPHSMRLLDANGRRVGGRFRVSDPTVANGGRAQLSATWKTGNPVRIDYGSGTLALPSP